MEDCYLRFEKEFWTSRGRKTIYPAGRNLFYEVETMSSVDGGESKHYYVYDYPNVHLGLYDEEEFQESFMTKEEFRDRKIDDII